MGNQGPVVVSSQGGVEVAGQGQNVATARSEQAEEKKLSVDGKKIYPTDVFADTVHLKTDLTVGSGVALTDGCVSAQHIATDAVTTEKINAGAVTAAEMTVSTLSSISANLGTITGGSLAIGSGGVSIGSSTAGVAIIGNQIYCKKSGATTVLIDGDSGVLTATKFQMTADADSSVDLSLGTHILATSITVGAQTLGDIQTNATNGNAAYAGTTLYRSGGAPTNAPSPTGLTTTTNSNGTVNYKLEWGAYTQGAKQADFIILFWRKDGSAPTVNDSSITFNVNTSGASYYIFEGVNGADTWSWGVAAARRTENGIEIGTIRAPTSAPDWRGVTSGTPNYTAKVGGTAAATVASGAAAGGTAVQPNGTSGTTGLVVNASTRKLEKIYLSSSGIDITTAASGARLLMNSAGLVLNNSAGNTIVSIDSTNGIKIANKTSDDSPAALERLSFCNNAGTECLFLYAPYTGATAAIKSGTGIALGLTGSSGSNYTSSIRLDGGAASSDSEIVYRANTHIFNNHGNTAGGSIQGVHKAWDGSYKANGSFTFYAAASSGGSATRLHTVTFEDGLIVSWSAA